MTLSSPLTDIKGIGPAAAQKFAVLGIKDVDQLIDYFPRRYEDYSNLLNTSDVTPGPVTVKATIGTISGRYVRRGMHITEAIASDAQGSIKLVWFNQPYRATGLKSGQEYYISGNYELSQTRFSIQNPNLELVSDFTINTARIIPVYKETKGLTSRQIRTALAEALPLIRRLPDTLPAWIVAEQSLVSYATATESIHFPNSTADLEIARARLGFEEVFQLTLAALINKQSNDHETSVAVPFNLELAKSFVKNLPFALTDAQRIVIWRIYQDLTRKEPMNRLVEGDVGAGKTVVAAMAALMALAKGWQVALMAPTELLARQHADTLYKLLNPLGYADRVILLVGSLSKSQKIAGRAAIASGDAQLLIGTQALIQSGVDVHRLALVIIDEQHRFGVDQRKSLQAKAGHMPHVLSLTATPIPRSLALTLYGELDISILNSKPVGRKPIITEIISPNSRKELYIKIDAELALGRQMFVVCPLITDSATVEANSAEKVYKDMNSRDFKHRRVGLLHGKLKPAEKMSIMAEFVAHRLDILVSTTVIEVGVDVPNASIMIIEGAERFGLAQAHQLRGRVGRGAGQGYCYLMMSDSRPPGRRLRALESSNDGFKLAELDLELRGPGAIYGKMQHGQLDLRIAKLTDTQLISRARQAAQRFLDDGEDLVHYKQLAQSVSRLRAVTNLN